MLVKLAKQRGCGGEPSDVHELDRLVAWNVLQHALRRRFRDVTDALGTRGVAVRTLDACNLALCLRVVVGSARWLGVRTTTRQSARRRRISASRPEENCTIVAKARRRRAGTEQASTGNLSRPVLSGRACESADEGTALSQGRLRCAKPGLRQQCGCPGGML